MIESAYKNYNCFSFPEFSNFPGNFPSFSLNKNLIRIITNIKKKILYTILLLGFISTQCLIDMIPITD
jgi:hypothetical protein